MSHIYFSGNLVDLKVLPQTLLEKVQQFGDKFKLMLEAKVVKVTQDKDKVQYVYNECDHHSTKPVTDVQVEVAFRGPRLTSSVKGDKVIITPPTTAQRTIQVLSFKMFIINNVSSPARATAPIY